MYLMRGAAVEQVQVVGQAIIVWTHLHHQFRTHCPHTRTHAHTHTHTGSALLCTGIVNHMLNVSPSEHWSQMDWLDDWLTSFIMPNHTGQGVLHVSNAVSHPSVSAPSTTMVYFMVMVMVTTNTK